VNFRDFILNLLNSEVFINVYEEDSFKKMSINETIKILENEETYKD